VGKKGAQESAHAAAAAEAIVNGLAPLGDVTSRKMFGGFGIFESGVMFALVDSAGVAFFRLGSGYEDLVVERHERMPYGRVPSKILDDEAQLIEWATSALEVARAAKKK
jgi:DNA transformation protein